MNFNTMLYRFGLDPNDFDNRLTEPIETKDGYIYELWQKDKDRICPNCGCTNCHIHGHRKVSIKCTTNSNQIETFFIHKIRYLCNNCHHTFTNPINGIEPSDRITELTKKMICADFTKMLSFEDIAQNYDLTNSRVLQLFDEQFPFVPRRALPKVLCVDEKCFYDSEENSKYCCILYDYETRTVIDVLKTRRFAYLDEYFKQIPLKERENVKYFVSDMNDTYSAIYRKYFPNSVYIIDLFHIVKLFTETIKSLRIETMNSTNRKSVEYKFMKKYWKLFYKRKEEIPDKFFEVKNSGIRYHYDDLIFDCLKLNDDFKEAYNILQDFYHYYLKTNLQEAQTFVNFIINRCNTSGNESISSIGKTFRKWQYGIANSIVRSSKDFHPSNSVAEGNNAHIETLIRISYGYKNFERFRKRVMLIRGKKGK